jgi:cytochrome d ubiquinol oxidase subunit II
MDWLQTLWFILIAVLWTGFLFLEGFDFGVGMRVLFGRHSETERRVLLNTIGPVWDGNEVWLITAGGAMFAAFPMWYASLISTLYVPVVLVLLGLIFRAVGVEYRGKGSGDRWRRAWDVAIGIGSAVAAFGVGALLALTTTGLPIDANGDPVGGAFAFLTPWAVVGGLAVVGFSCAHAAAFVGLKADGQVRTRAARFASVWAPLCLVPLAVWVTALQVRSGDVVGWVVTVVAVGCALAGWLAARAGREGFAFVGFGGFVVAGVGAVFWAAYPVVLPSTIDGAFDLTVANASSSSYTLGVMSVVALFGVPLVLAYQAWSYWVFRKRIAPAHIPEAREVGGPGAPALTGRP